MNIIESILIVGASSHSEAASSGNPLTDITREFHIYTPLFVSQLVTFILVIFILKKFAFGPVQEMLEKRRKRIADGEEKLKLIQKQLEESEERTAQAIADANSQAKRLVDEAKESAAALSEQKKAEAISSAQNILSRAEEAAKQEREMMTSEIRKEFGRLVINTTSKVSGKVLTNEDQSRLNDEALTAINQN